MWRAALRALDADDGSNAGARVALEIGVHHHPYERLEVDLGFPAERAAGLGAVPNQVIDLGRTEELRVELDVLRPVEADVLERDLHELPHGVAFTRGDD